MLKSIIFDFDGVLGNTLEPLTEFLSKLTWQPKAKVRGGILNLLMSNQKENRLQRYFKDLLAPKFEKYLLTTEDYFFEDRLRELENLVVPMAILTNNYSSICKKLLGDYVSMFEIIVGDNEADTKIGGFELIFQRPNFTKSNSIFITDSVGDVLEAALVLSKSQIYAVSWGFHNTDVLKKYLPSDRILNNFKTLKK